MKGVRQFCFAPFLFVHGLYNYNLNFFIFYTFVSLRKRSHYGQLLFCTPYSFKNQEQTY